MKNNARLGIQAKTECENKKEREKGHKGNKEEKTKQSTEHGKRVTVGGDKGFRYDSMGVDIGLALWFCRRVLERVTKSTGQKSDWESEDGGWRVRMDGKHSTAFSG